MPCNSSEFARNSSSFADNFDNAIFTCCQYISNFPPIPLVCPELLSSSSSSLILFSISSDESFKRLTSSSVLTGSLFFRSSFKSSSSRLSFSGARSRWIDSFNASVSDRICASTSSMDRWSDNTSSCINRLRCWASLRLCSTRCNSCRCSFKRSSLRKSSSSARLIFPTALTNSSKSLSLKLSLNVLILSFNCCCSSSNFAISARKSLPLNQFAAFDFSNSL
mmetsp:Transcript_25225/g.39032  ORF Transcript_25225/g.39032 Transcript_25225/m.39032 type:complete len:222 (-) Transcript_25225:2078-2743(-)